MTADKAPSGAELFSLPACLRKHANYIATLEDVVRLMPLLVPDLRTAAELIEHADERAAEQHGTKPRAVTDFFRPFGKISNVGVSFAADKEVTVEQATAIRDKLAPEFATGDWLDVEREKLANAYEQTRNAIAVAREKTIDDLRSQLSDAKQKIERVTREFEREAAELAQSKSAVVNLKFEIARLKAEVEKARADEREACAKVADSWPSTIVESNAHPLARDGIAAAIRSRT